MPQTAFVSTETFSQDEFEEWLAELSQEDTNRYELLNGSIVVCPPATWPHGNTGARIVRYERNGVDEYWLVDTDRREVTMFRLENGSYGAPLLFRTSDTLTSAVLPQLRLPVRNLFA